MRILLLTEFFPDFDKRAFTGGVEARIFYTALFLSKNHQVFVIARRKKSQEKREIRQNLTIIRVGSETEDSLATFPSVLDRLIFTILAFWQGVKLKIDLVEGSNYVAFIPAFLIGIFKKIPKIAWYPDTLIGKWRKYFGLVGFFGEIGERVFVKLGWDKIITISPAVKERLVNYGVRQEKIKVVFCGVDRKVFKPLKKYKTKTLCVVSRLLPYKRAEDAIKALACVNKKTKTAFKIIGSGPGKENLIFLARRLKILKRVKFYESIDQKRLAQILGRSHILVHPSVVEGFGIVILEAAGSGTPFIAASIPTSKMLAEKLRSGLLFKKKNAKELAEKILELFENKKLYEKLRKNGIENAKKFSWEKLGRETEKVFFSEKGLTL